MSDADWPEEEEREEDEEEEEDDDIDAKTEEEVVKDDDDDEGEREVTESILMISPGDFPSRGISSCRKCEQWVRSVEKSEIGNTASAGERKCGEKAKMSEERLVKEGSSCWSERAGQ